MYTKILIIDNFANQKLDISKIKFKCKLICIETKHWKNNQNKVDKKLTKKHDGSI